MAVSLCAVMAQGAELERWLRFDQATLGTRFIGVNAGDGSRVRQQQHQEWLGMSLLLDRGGKLRLSAVGGSGPYFSGGWNHTAWGNAPGLARPFWRQFYLSADVARGVEYQYGGLGTDPSGTGMVGMAGVGYLMGHRLGFRKRWGLDRVVATYGYLGDWNQPDVSRRWSGLGRSNFRDLLVEKSRGRWTWTGSGTSFGGRAIASGGVRVEVATGTTVRLEAYRREHFSPGGGFHAGADKRWSSRFTTGAGYVSVDRNFGRWNSDAFWDGNRYYATGGWTLGRGVTLSALWNHAAHNQQVPTMKQFFMAGVNYNLLSLLRH